MDTRYLHITASLLATLAVCTTVAGQDVPLNIDAPRMDAQQIEQELEDRRAEFEKRYGYDDWLNKDASPLRLGRFLPLVQIEELPRMRLHTPVEPRFRRHYGGGSALEYRFLWRPDDAPEGEPSPWGFHVTLWVCESSEDAQAAMMGGFYDLRSAIPHSPPSLPWGEERLDGVGDVCFGQLSISRGRLYCVTSNIYFEMRGRFDHRKFGHTERLRVSPRDGGELIQLARAFVAKLNEADRQRRNEVADGTHEPIEFEFFRYRGIPPGLSRRDEIQWVRVEKKPGRTEKEIDSFDPGIRRPITFIAHHPDGSPVPQYEWAAVAGGRVQRSWDNPWKYSIHLVSEEPGPRSFHYIAQYEDGSFEFVEDELVVRSSNERSE